MRFIFLVVFSIIFVLSLLGFQEISAQIDPCFESRPVKDLEREFTDFSKKEFSDWKLVEFEVEGCFGSVVATYELPQFSTNDASYQVNMYFGPFCYSKPYSQSCELETKNEDVSEQLSKLHSTKFFEEINEKLNLKKINFDYHSTKFEIIAENQHGNSSEFTIDTTREFLELAKFTNDIDLDSSVIYTKTRKYLENYLKDYDTNCQIQSCNESSCAETELGRSPWFPAWTFRGYGSTFELEGGTCPSFATVTLSEDLEFFSLGYWSSDKDSNYRPFIPSDSEKTYELDLGYSIKKIPYSMTYGKINQITLDNGSINVILEVSNNSVFAINLQNFTDLESGEFAHIDDISVKLDGREIEFQTSSNSDSLIIGFGVNSLSKNVEIITKNNEVTNLDSSESLIDESPWQPPKKQMKITHSFNLISCRDGFTLIFKIYPYGPACVRPATAEKLFQREWGRSEPYNQCLEIEKTRKYTPVPFKSPETLPTGFSFECAREDVQQVGDIFYLKETPENLSLNQDEVLRLQGIQIHFFQYLNFADSNELTGNEKIQLLQEKIGERSSLVDINGHLGLVVEGCGNCGTKTAHMTDGTTVSSTFPTPNRVEFYDENSVKYSIRSYQPTEILLELARSLK